MEKSGLSGNLLVHNGDFGTFEPPKLTGDFVNVTGLQMAYVAPHASFEMGGGTYEQQADSLPRHSVLLTDAFAISRTPVPYDLFCRFWAQTRQDAPDVEACHGFVVGVSWYEAADFCRWLSAQEGVQYCLPTEAQWEYCARNADALDMDRMCDLRMREWCFDWYAPYDDLPVCDPAGPDLGLFKAVRGGYLDDPGRYNEYPLDLWLRGALPPSYRHDRRDRNNRFGRHRIGFRVVCAPLAKTSGAAAACPMCFGVHQNTAEYLTIGPDAQKPYFRKRHLFPVPPDNTPNQAIRAVGMNPVMRHHHHSPAFTVAPNGDLLFTAYSSYHEYDAQVGLVGARLRRGCDQWEFPDIFLNPVGVNDHAPLLFTDDDGTIYHFWGWQQLADAYPFQYVCSKDSGATWSAVQFPYFPDKTQGFERQPVNNCIRAKDGTVYFTADAAGLAASVLWRSRDNMRTWSRGAALTAGRHSTIVQRRDSAILALGGKNTQLDGFMPKAVSHDGGDSWQVTPTPFPALNSGQRPCVIRLASGRLFACGDYQALKHFAQPAGVTEKGCYGAWSDDDGETWTMRRLWGTQPHKQRPERPQDHILGYSVCRQSQDGLIHIVISNTAPLLHLEFNEAWLTQHDPDDFPPDSVLMCPGATKLVGPRRQYEDYDENGALVCRWSGGIADDGRFLLDGPETVYAPDGTVLMQGQYRLGRRVGKNTRYDGDHHPVWQMICQDDTIQYCTYYSKSDQLRTSCTFQNGYAQGAARTYDRAGNCIYQAQFDHGVIVSDSIKTVRP